MKISIVIPSYNGKSILEKNLPPLLQVIPADEIIIVDDASTDGSLEYLKKLGHKTKLISHGKNLGFSSSVNDGFIKAKNNLILLLNSDIAVFNNFLNQLTAHFRNPNVFAVGILQRCFEKREIIERGRGVGKFDRGFLHHARGEINKTDTLWVSGGAGMFRKDIWLTLGGLNQLYDPFYWEDIDISYRALKAGFTIIFDNICIVEHHQSLGAIRQNYSTKQIKSISYRNQILFIWLNITDTDLIIQHLLYLPYNLIRSFLAGDTTFIRGLLSALFKLKDVLNYRNINSKIKKLKDRDILINFC